jgi:prepilin-type N-terminal cleavage/methylation domain-containing protein
MIRTHRFRRTPSPAAFTMVELLVAMSILAVMMLLLLSIVNATTRMWRVSENRVDSYREARAALNVIDNDLQSILVSKKSKFFALDVKDGLPKSAVIAPKANNVFFVTTLASDSQDSSDDNRNGKPDNLSEICIVGYFLAYDSPTFGKVEPSMNLYRYFLSSDQSMAVLKDEDALTKNISTAPGSVNVEVLARNVLSLKINAFLVGADGKPAPFASGGTEAMPDFIDVQITALNNDSAKKMNKGNWESPETGMMKNIFNQEARTFSTRVNIAPYKIESVPQ